MDIDVILGMVCGYGAEQLLIAVAVSVVAALIKRKAKLDMRRELAARLVFSLALAARRADIRQELRVGSPHGVGRARIVVRFFQPRL